MDSIVTIMIQFLLFISEKRTIAQQEGALAAVWKGWRIHIKSISMGYQPPSDIHKAFYVVCSATRAYIVLPRRVSLGKPVK